MVNFCDLIDEKDKIWILSAWPLIQPIIEWLWIYAYMQTNQLVKAGSTDTNVDHQLETLRA